MEVAENSVIIRATRDTFTNTRKDSFIRELVAEGFISENYQWYSMSEPDAFTGLRWLVDQSWFTPPEPGMSRRLERRIFIGSGIIFVGLLLAIAQGWIGSGMTSDHPIKKNVRPQTHATGRVSLFERASPNYFLDSIS